MGFSGELNSLSKQVLFLLKQIPCVLQVLPGLGSENSSGGEIVLKSVQETRVFFLCVN